MKRALVLAMFILFTWAQFTSAEEQKISVGFQVPASNYSVKIQEVHQVGDEVWVISKVTGGGGIGLTVISDAKDSITLKDKGEGKVVHKVIGKSWNWGKDTESLHYVKDAKVLKDELKEKDAKLIWKREKPKAE